MTTASWAAALGVPTCVGDEFIEGYGRLPNSIAELEEWGKRTGRQASGGRWTCFGPTSGKGTAPGGVPSPSPTPGIPPIIGPTPGLPSTGSGQVDVILNWIKNNPAMAVAGAAVVYLFLSQTSRRR